MCYKSTPLNSDTWKNEPEYRQRGYQLVFGSRAGPPTSRLHAALEDDDLVVFGAGGQRRQASDVRVGSHVLQMMRSPHGFGQTLPALRIKRKEIKTRLECYEYLYPHSILTQVGAWSFFFF